LSALNLDGLDVDIEDGAAPLYVRMTKGSWIQQHREGSSVCVCVGLGNKLDLDIGEIDYNLAVEAARAHEGRVKDVGPVGACKHNHAAAARKPWGEKNLGQSAINA
jgi:hypothetical protein